MDLKNLIIYIPFSNLKVIKNHKSKYEKWFDFEVH